MAVFIIIPLILIAVFACTTTITVDADGNRLSEEDVLSIKEEYAEVYGEEADAELENAIFEKKVFTWDNLLGVSAYMPTLINSIWLALIATVICLLLGYPVAYIISRMHYSKQKMMVMLTMLPMWMNFLLRTYAWMTILENNGLLNKLFGLVGLGPFQFINTQGAVVLGMVYNYLPFMILPLYSIMTKIDDRTIEAARDLGAGSANVFLRIVLPLSTPGIASGISMVFVPAVSTFIISKMLGGGTNMLIGDLIDLQFLGNAYNPNLGAAISLVLMVFILLCMSITNSIDDEEMEAVIV
ncbi:MAG: ABC transporter permease [Ruminococcaceae bacterium]|nr:ABC transporter permease [Oscillospiraceae bacterium]